MNKRHYEHTLLNIRGSLSNTYGKTDFPALIPQNGAMAELLLSHLPEAAEVQDAVPVS